MFFFISFIVTFKQTLQSVLTDNTTLIKHLSLDRVFYISLDCYL